jgi:hypothetical protein
VLFVLWLTAFVIDTVLLKWNLSNTLYHIPSLAHKVLDWKCTTFDYLLQFSHSYILLVMYWFNFCFVFQIIVFCLKPCSYQRVVIEAKMICTTFDYLPQFPDSLFFLLGIYLLVLCIKWLYNLFHTIWLDWIKQHGWQEEEGKIPPQLETAVFNTPLHTRLMSRGTLLSFLKRNHMVWGSLEITNIKTGKHGQEQCHCLLP